MIDNIERMRLIRAAMSDALRARAVARTRREKAEWVATYHRLGALHRHALADHQFAQKVAA